MSELAALIAATVAEFAAFGDPARTLGELCGSADPDELASRFERWVVDNLEQTVVRPRFFTCSVGAVGALELDDGRVVVVKVHQRRVERDVLAAMQRVQHHLFDRGFPCPQPLTGPRSFGASLATADRWLDDGGNNFGTGAMAASAAGLASMVALAAEVDHVDALERAAMARAPGARYPTPHSPLFDFDRPDPRVAWIDSFADRALAVIDALDAPAVTAHGDWSARNVRFGPDGLRGVYDWDSLIRLPEAIAVGIAAATWRSFGSADDDIAPDAVEVAQYTRRYEAARGEPFSPAARAAVLAQALYALCYTARCEISLGPGHPRRAIARLESSAPAFLPA
jgi:hypothetical protein